MIFHRQHTCSNCGHEYTWEFIYPAPGEVIRHQPTKYVEAKLLGKINFDIGVGEESPIKLQLCCPEPQCSQNDIITVHCKCDG